MTSRTARSFKSLLRTHGFPIGLGIVSIIASLMFAPVILNMINAGNDYPAHLFSAETWAKYGYPDRPRPQFLFHVLVIIFYRTIPGVSILYAGSLLAVIYYIALVAIIFILIYPLLKTLTPLLRLTCAVALALTLVLVGPINLVDTSNLYFGYIPSNSYHNPTIALLKPFALLLFLYACRAYSDGRKSSLHIIVCALISALGTMAKPSYAIVIIPVLGLLTVVHWWRRQPINWMLLIAGIGLPIAIVLIWQQNYYHDSSMGGFIFAPFAVMSSYSPTNLLPKLLLSIAFPCAVLVFYCRSALKDTAMQVSWLGFLVGAIYTYFLGESATLLDGNFTWSGQVSIFILFVASTLFLVKQNAVLVAQHRFTKAFIICTLLLILHLVGGIMLYLACLKPDWGNFM